MVIERHDVVDTPTEPPHDDGGAVGATARALACCLLEGSVGTAARARACLQEGGNVDGAAGRARIFCLRDPGGVVDGARSGRPELPCGTAPRRSDGGGSAQQQLRQQRLQGVP